MNSNLHRQLAKILHTKTGVALSSFLCEDVTELTSKRAFNTLRQEDIKSDEVGHWLIQCAEPTTTGRLTLLTLGVVYCPYIDAVNTALCLKPAWEAYQRRASELYNGREPSRDSWVGITPIDSAIASADAVELSLLEHANERKVLFFDEWLATKYEVPKDQKRNFVDDVSSHINVAVYGPSNAAVILLHNEHTDDISIQYGNLIFADNMEREVEAVAYKVYLCLMNEIDEDELAEYFGHPMKVRTRP